MYFNVQYHEMDLVIDRLFVGVAVVVVVVEIVGSFVRSLPSFLRWFVAIVPSLVRCHRSFVGSFLRSFVPSLRSFVPSFLRAFAPFCVVIRSLAH